MFALSFPGVFPHYKKAIRKETEFLTLGHWEEGVIDKQTL